MHKKFKFCLQILGPLIFIYILFQINYGLIFKEIKLLKWHFLIFSLALMVTETIIRSLRWRVILSSLNISISRAKSLSLYFAGGFMGIITPGHIGEVIKVYFLKHKGHSAFRSLFSVILDRVIDIVVLLVLGFLVFIFFLRQIGIYIALVGIILAAGVVFIFMLLNPDSYLHKLFGTLIQKIIPIDFNHYNKFTFKKFWRGIKELRKKDTFLFLIYLVIGWSFYFYARYAISEALGLNLSLLQVVIVSVLSTIVALLPISVAGIGTREITTIYVFGLFGVNKEAAVLFSLFVFTINITSVALGFIPYIRESALINKVKKYAA